MFYDSHFEGTGDTDDTTGEASASIASLERLIISTFTEIVGAGVANHGATNDRGRSAKHELVISGVVETLAVGASLDVAEITMVSDSLAGSTVGFSLGVPVRSSSFAAFDEVT